MPGSSELIGFGNRISKILDAGSLRAVTMAGGMAGKAASLAAASSDLGGDRAFSGMKRRTALGAGFDQVGSTKVQINYRPAGLWKLAESGRRSGKIIRPRRARALFTPDGPRARSTVGAWGGKGTYTSAVRASRIAVPKAAFAAFRLEVAKAVR